MSEPIKLPQRPSLAGRKEALRLEGLVVEKRLTHVETARYLIINFLTGSISVYKDPPPTESLRGTPKSRSSPHGFLPFASHRHSKSKSDDGGGDAVTWDNLAHVSRKKRYLGSVSWDPKIMVPASVDWRIRDVENDETMFYLVLPASFKKKDSDAELFSLKRSGNKIEYTSERDLNLNLDSIKEGEENVGGYEVGSPASGNDDVSDSSVSSSFSVSSSSSKISSMFGKTFKRSSHNDQEVVYMFRVLSDGNEKFIWLQAAAELGRLSTESSMRLIPNTQGVSKIIPMSMSPGRSNPTALRYAEWARLIDQKKSVSTFHFDVHDIRHETKPQDDPRSSLGLDDSSRYDSKRLVKVIPTYAYRNRRMTEKDLYSDMTTASEKWEDFRGQPVGDREEERIGSLHAEVLACHGLPKLDAMSGTDAVCYFVCGPFGFASDVIDGFMSPVWPSKSRRACIFPIFYACQKLFVGVFDDDGPAAQDDFAGRVVIDLAKLRPNSVYDLFIPLRQYQNTYVKTPRGVIHLRLRLEWDNERTALLSYLKLPKKTKHLGNAVTLNCADHKAFRNVVLTVQGKDIPGKYKKLVQTGLKREMKLYQFAVKTSMKEQMLDIAIYKVPSTSICFFIAWMHCVYSNSMAYVPVYLMAVIIASLLKNYFKYGANEEFNFGFTPITMSEMFRVLLYGGPNTKFIKPIKVTRKNNFSESTRNSHDELDGDDENIIHQTFDSGVGFRMDGDHMEFPFSEAGRYPKKTLREACVAVDASVMFQEAEEQAETKQPGALASLRRTAKKGRQVIHLPRSNRDDDEELEDEDDEFGVMVKSKFSPETTNVQNTSTNNGQEVDEPTTPCEVWKRVKDPRGLPEQDARVFVKARRSLKEDLIHHKNLLQKLSMRMFDDRMFIVNEEDPGHIAGEERALHQVIGTNKYSSPLVAAVAGPVAPLLEMLKIGLSAYRSVFNIFTWRDPFLTFLFLFGAVFLLCVLLIFPWRIFLFVMGLGGVGPQNWLLRVYGKLPKKKKSADKEAKKPEKPKRNQSKDANNFQFHNHLSTTGGKDQRQKKSDKSTTSVHRAVVPNSPLISRRFYDWPPNPSLSKVDIYSE